MITVDVFITVAVGGGEALVFNWMTLGLDFIYIVYYG